LKKISQFQVCITEDDRLTMGLVLSFWTLICRSNRRS